MSLVGRAVVGLLPLVPRRVVARFARPYVAGESLTDAVETVESLMAEGCAASIDVLGEESTTTDEARALTELYLAVLDRISRQRLDAHVSVKLSGLGIRVDPALAEANLRTIVERAAAAGSFVRIDMEGSSLTDATLEVYRALATERDHLGIVLQASLRRTLDDVAALAPLCADVRVVKGIYVEPEPIAYRGAQVIRDRYIDVVEALLRAGCRTAIATHDDQLVRRSLELVTHLDVPRERYQFQVLLGVRRHLRRQLVADGHKVRVYVPFGEDWYAYSLRRLRENPAIAGHVVRNLVPSGSRRAA